MRLEEQFYIAVHRGTFDIVQLEHFCDGPEELQPKSRTDPRLGTTSDEEFDIRDFIHTAGEDREDGRGWLLVFALVKGINDDQSRNACGFERSDNEFLHL